MDPLNDAILAVVQERDRLRAENERLKQNISAIRNAATTLPVSLCAVDGVLFVPADRYNYFVKVINHALRGEVE